ncbi:MAG: aminotransferase class I/II-fold pyridoxal phosphate-dependent enzyme [Candidatus Obscuribacterales bacterium]|nr:aminotransferase class I/II-fold pyridoxal phosphate-dependent enzyme [Candidatus Obscuribacterales bacterium]
MSRKKNENTDAYKMRTRLIHGALNSRLWDYNHHIVPPISASAAYKLDSVHRGAEGFSQYGSESAEHEAPIYIYDRLQEPTSGFLEENLATAEGGETAVCFATGMAAIAAALGVTTQSGDEIVAHHTLYGCTYSLLSHWLPRFNIKTVFADLSNEDSLLQSVTGQTRVVYLETPVNPTLQLIDIEAVRRVLDRINTARAADRQLILIVDNTFATPYCQRPLSLGADLVVHSLTKNIGGFGTDMGGAVVCPRLYHEQLLLFRKDFGGVLAPKNAWSILVYGLPTLAARIVNQQKSALKVAQYLERHPKVESVVYPGLASFSQHALARKQMVSPDGKFAPGFMLYFVLKGKPATAALSAERCIDYIAKNAYSITLAVSLGQIRTLIEEPFSMTHSALPPEMKIARGMSPGAIRLSIGLEDWHDIIGDLERALEQV